MVPARLAFDGAVVVLADVTWLVDGPAPRIPLTRRVGGGGPRQRPWCRRRHHRAARRPGRSTAVADADGAARPSASRRGRTSAGAERHARVAAAPIRAEGSERREVEVPLVDAGTAVVGTVDRRRAVKGQFGSSSCPTTIITPRGGGAGRLRRRRGAAGALAWSPGRRATWALALTAAVVTVGARARSA
ncbi:MAG: hypothetical protein R2939_09975 [Kofleriaceae bacterium]